MSKNYFEVIRAGINTTFQDEGRSNLYHIGIPFSGAMDNRNYLISNKLVGNLLSMPVIEFAYQGPLLKYHGKKLNFAITGDVTFMLKKNDKSYKIHGLTGTNFYIDNIKDCYDTEKKISKKILNIYQYTEKVNINEAFTNVDEKSNMRGTGIFLKSGDVVNAVCYDRSDESGKDDNFKISFLTEELNDWINSN